MAAVRPPGRRGGHSRRPARRGRVVGAAAAVCAGLALGSAGDRHRPRVGRCGCCCCSPGRSRCSPGRCSTGRWLSPSATAPTRCRRRRRWPWPWPRWTPGGPAWPWLAIDLLNRTVRAGEHALHLTAPEQRLLYLPAANDGRVLTREELLDRLWDVDFVTESTVVDRHARSLPATLQNDWREAGAFAGRYAPSSAREPPDAARRAGATRRRPRGPSGARSPPRGRRSRRRRRPPAPAGRGGRAGPAGRRAAPPGGTRPGPR